jgi:hypothetical protein
MIIIIIRDNNDILIRWDGNLLFKQSDIFPLKPLCFNEYNVFIPNKTETILAQIYGKKWNIPRSKDYNWDNINTVDRLVIPQKKSYSNRIIQKNVQPDKPDDISFKFCTKNKKPQHQQANTRPMIIYNQPKYNVTNYILDDNEPLVLNVIKNNTSTKQKHHYPLNKFTSQMSYTYNNVHEYY